MKKRIVLFCGGSGACELVKTLTRADDIDLTILVNCYDDGLSTGQLRACIPGMLGPSDVRKNVKHSLRREAACSAGFDFILTFRLPDTIPTEAARDFLRAILRNTDLMGGLDEHKLLFLSNAIERFLQYNEATDSGFSFNQVSLENIFFAGLYLEYFKRC